MRYNQQRNETTHVKPKNVKPKNVKRYQFVQQKHQKGEKKKNILNLLDLQSRKYKKVNKKLKKLYVIKSPTFDREKSFDINKQKTQQTFLPEKYSKEKEKNEKQKKKTFNYQKIFEQKNEKKCFNEKMIKKKYAEKLKRKKLLKRKKYPSISELKLQNAKLCKEKIEKLNEEWENVYRNVK